MSRPDDCPDVTLRSGDESDLAAVASIQTASPAASQWDVREYLKYDFEIAACGGRVAAFAVSRQVFPGEVELLNLAVDPKYRRRGIARRLLSKVIQKYPGDIWLEVRASNDAARKLYKSLGFVECRERPNYYPGSPESAIVMNFHS